MRFTADQAFEASEDGDPIMISAASAAAIIGQHQATLCEFESDRGERAESYDAAAVLAWLGY